MRQKITIISDCPFKQSLCARINGNQIKGCPLCYPYAIGKRKPNYPMPAIPLQVKRGGLTWRWLSIYNPVTRKILRYWHEDGTTL